MQVVPRPTKRARNSAHGDPDWQQVGSPVIIEDEKINILREGVDGNGEKKGVLDVAAAVGLDTKLDRETQRAAPAQPQNGRALEQRGLQQAACAAGWLSKIGVHHGGA